MPRPFVCADDRVDTGAHKIDLQGWERRAVFQFFREFEEPYHGVCVRVDCTETYRFAKENSLPLFLSMVHRALTAAQMVPHFRTRLIDDDVWMYDRIHGGSAVGRANGTIGFGHYPFVDGLKEFVHSASIEVERVKARDDLERHGDADLIRFSVLPWFDFTSISHARRFSKPDSAPYITFGKMTEVGGRRTMPVSIHVHHGLVDGLQVAQFVDGFQARLSAPESV